MALRSLAGKTRGFLPRRAAAFDLKASLTTDARDTVKEIIEHRLIKNPALVLGAGVAIGTGISAFGISAIREMDKERKEAEFGISVIPESFPEMHNQNDKKQMKESAFGISDIPESISEMYRQNDMEQTKEVFVKLFNLTLDAERRLDAASGDPEKVKAAAESAFSLVDKLEDLQKRNKLMPSDVLSALEDYEKLEMAKSQTN